MGEHQESSSSDASLDEIPHANEAIPKGEATTPEFFYYQNPTTGTVSTTPLSVEQLVKLLVPIRDGMSAILPPHTQCLAVASNPTAVQGTTFGEWKPISTVDVLKEAACSQWYLSGGENKSSDEGSPATQGPMTCRALVDAYDHAADKSKLLAFAPEITTKWTFVEKLPLLQKAINALRPPPGSSLHDVSDPIPESDIVDVTNDVKNQQVQDELEAFLLSTAAVDAGNDDDDDDGGHGYESDGGTRYVKDPFSGHWIHEALAPQPEKKRTKPTSQPDKTPTNTNTSKKSHKKAKFAKRNARHWIYVTGLPTTASDMAELHKFFGKVGMLDLDPETMHPKIKLYRHADGTPKGDASVCYARPESVDLALQVLDESLWDENHTIRIERAKFKAKEGESTDAPGKRERKSISQAQRKVARLALLQAQDEGFGERLAGGRKGLRIVVVKHMLDGILEADWESMIQKYCTELDANVEKITCISKTKVVIVKFVEPTAASQAVEAWNGKLNTTAQVAIDAFYWDGVTDYTQSGEEHNPEEEAKRHEDFGRWLDNQGDEELPPELRLQVAED